MDERIGLPNQQIVRDQSPPFSFTVTNKCSHVYKVGEERLKEKESKKRKKKKDSAQTIKGLKRLAIRRRREREKGQQPKSSYNVRRC
uniref:Uncharacterized protein n=1 Tax=Pristionchus pacificus TaxID=54126 RepID=A0A2A6D0X3_PRIPA|eukprot:PDM84114.1 hypothetical protein PRIPAC_34306 [Pristionchus pacificus]